MSKTVIAAIGVLFVILVGAATLIGTYFKYANMKAEFETSI